MIGACIFSFLNVVADRLPREESVVRGRSHCTVCGRTLGPLELIPCVSFLTLRGKCKGCKTAIPKRCFLSECLGGAAFVCCGMKFGCGALGILSLGGAVVFCYIGILLVVALIDWDTQMIYDRFHILILLLGMASLWLFPQHVTAYAADTGCLWRRGHQTDGGIRLVSRMCTGDMCHVFRDSDRWDICRRNAGNKEAWRKGPFCFWSFSCGRTDDRSCLGGCDRHLVSSIFIERKRYGTISLHGKKYEW